MTMELATVTFDARGKSRSRILVNKIYRRRGKYKQKRNTQK